MCIILERTVNFIIASLKQEYAQGLMEYALILVLISVASFVIMGILGVDIAGLFVQVSNGF